MNIYTKLEEKQGCSLALGFFDGVHQGHKVVIKNAVNFAKENCKESAIIIFKQHPMSYISKNQVKQIVKLEDKLQMLENLDVDNVVLLDFDENISKLSASEYLKDVLIKYFSPIAITTGFNHSFGKSRQGNSSFLRNFQSKYNYRYFEIPPITCNNIVTSSSSIRNALSCGNLDLANTLLGYKFFVRATVVQGEKIGREINFPTANFEYPTGIIEVPTGVYLVESTIDSKKYKGVLNYGTRPTINDNLPQRAEVHFIDFEGNLYGKEIKVSFVTKIRNEMKFASLTQLKSQIIKDIDFASSYIIN